MIIIFTEGELNFTLKWGQFRVRRGHEQGAGQTLEHVGIVLPTQVFSHVSSNVKILRETSPNRLYISVKRSQAEEPTCDPTTAQCTANAIYHEVCVVRASLNTYVMNQVLVDAGTDWT